MGTIASINNVASADISEINGIAVADIASVLGQSLSSVPPIPDLSNSVLAVGMWNWLPVAYPVGLAVDLEDGVGGVPFVGTAPYPVDWGAVLGGDPPYSLDVWYDQTVPDFTGNNLQASGGARPTLVVMTAVVVTGIGAGTYTWRGINADFSPPAPYYNLVGQPDNPYAYSIYATSDAPDQQWNIYDDSGSINNATDLGLAFPWLASWTGSVVTASTGQGSAQGGSGMGMAGANPLFA